MRDRFRRWDEHHGKILDEEASRKRQIEEEKRRNKAKRDKIFRILLNRQEATHQRLLDKNHDEAEQLYHEANEREQKWIEKRSKARHEWQEHVTPPHLDTSSLNMAKQVSSGC